MKEKSPGVIVLAGPNGAGKSTTAPKLAKKNRRNVDQLIEDDRLIESALREGVRDALRRHKQAGLPVAAHFAVDPDLVYFATGQRANRFPCQRKVAVIASGAAPDDNGPHIERTSNRLFRLSGFSTLESAATDAVL